MSIEEIRKLHYKEEGREEGREEERARVMEEKKQLILKQYKMGLSIEYMAEINGLDVEYVKNILKDNHQ